MDADAFLIGFLAGTWATCLTIMSVLEIRARWAEKEKE
jgi:hypothetical protein